MSENPIGEVIEALPNVQYRVMIDGKEYRCYLAGKMKLHKIKVLVGDKVEVKVEDIGNIHRIVRRK